MHNVLPIITIHCHWQKPANCIILSDLQKRSNNAKLEVWLSNFTAYTNIFHFRLFARSAWPETWAGESFLSYCHSLLNILNFEMHTKELFPGSIWKGQTAWTGTAWSAMRRHFYRSEPSFGASLKEAWREEFRTLDIVPSDFSCSVVVEAKPEILWPDISCLLYTSDAADE